MGSEAATIFGCEDVEILDSTKLHDGFLRIDRLRLRCRLYQGGWSPEFTREVLHRAPGVGVLLYDPLLDKVLLVEQFRVGCLDDSRNGPWALELVAGLLEQGECPEDVAFREVEEETGITISQLLPVCEYYNSPGGSSEKLNVFCSQFDTSLARVGIFGVETEFENIRTVVLSRQDALAAVQSGRINNAMTIIALQWLQLNLAEVRAALNSPSTPNTTASR